MEISSLQKARYEYAPKLPGMLRNGIADICVVEGEETQSVADQEKIKELFPDTLLMFVTPPDAATLKERLIGRGTEPIDVVNARLSRAFEESLGVEAYDYLIVNDALDVCVEEVHSIIRNEHQKVSRNQEFINRIKEELKGFSKGE